jgi:hypothetical protein
MFSRVLRVCNFHMQRQTEREARGGYTPPQKYN